MNLTIKPMNLKMWITFLVFNFIQVALWAQEGSGSGSGSSTTTTSKKIDVSVSSSDNWYTSPWVWIVGAAVFILLLVALLGGNRGGSTSTASDRVTVTKTVERDTDV
ncbi:MAG TPA: hypothetical protein VHK91_05255 [Flavisolibacter sp.]|jgi:hypothetical protein|nr:hypothetical protein [Flavisolibacter sp.]